MSVCDVVNVSGQSNESKHPGERETCPSLHPPSLQLQSHTRDKNILLAVLPLLPPLLPHELSIPVPPHLIASPHPERHGPVPHYFSPAHFPSLSLSLLSSLSPLAPLSRARQLCQSCKLSRSRQTRQTSCLTMTFKV